jgi:hypothetical protein
MEPGIGFECSRARYFQQDKTCAVWKWWVPESQKRTAEWTDSAETMNCEPAPSVPLKHFDCPVDTPDWMTKTLERGARFQAGITRIHTTSKLASKQDEAIREVVWGVRQTAPVLCRRSSEYPRRPGLPRASTDGCVSKTRIIQDY